tara:strand:+ start:222 stop:614 length:393 start_codon:yes stop_codon:yes gene_type:complete
MNLKNIFKKFVLIDLLLLTLVIFSLFFENEMVTNFNESINPQNDMNDMIGIIALILLIVYLVNLYLLYKFKPIGKQLYLFVIIFMLILSLLSGTNAASPIQYVLDGLGWANSGAILVLLYFSPIKKEFDK